MKPNRYFTGKPCRQGHIAERFLGNRECVECARLRWARDPNKTARAKAAAHKARHKRREYAKNRYWSDLEKSREYHKQIRLKNIDGYTAREAESRKKNANHRREYFKRRYSTTPEFSKAASKKWTTANRHKVTAAAARRRAAELRATPVWADHEIIATFYALAKSRTESTGIVHHVDHIIPLRGKAVCGLHVHNNLQVLTASENSRKRNHFTAALSSSREDEGKSPVPPQIPIRR